jgi:hypothetical protein
MRPILSPILFEDRCSAVGDLQFALQTLIGLDLFGGDDPAPVQELVTNIAPESARQFYGEVTRKLVTLYQETRRLPANGEVDEETAKALNDELLQALLLDIPGETIPSVVRGRVSSRRLTGVPRLRVAAVDKNVGVDTHLDDAMTGEGGIFEILYDPAKRRQGKASLDLQVQVLDREDNILAVSAVRFNASLEETGLNIVIPAKKLERPRCSGDQKPPGRPQRERSTAGHHLPRQQDWLGCASGGHGGASEPIRE